MPRYTVQPLCVSISEIKNPQALRHWQELPALLAPLDLREALFLVSEATVEQQRKNGQLEN